MNYELENLAHIAECISAIAVVAALIFAYIQLRAVKSIEEAKLWLEIRKSVKDCDKMHILIANEVFDKTKAIELLEAYEADIMFDYDIELYNYLGNFEILSLMLNNKVISRKMFESQHLYRLQILAQHKDIMKMIYNDSGDYWVVIRNLFYDFNLLPKNK